jgi:ariadne-1
MFTLLACGHQFCIDCTRSHLTKLVDNCEVAKLKCADYECRATFSEEEYRQILDEQTASKMRRFVTALRVARDEDLFYCPSTECEIPLSLKACKKVQQKGPLTCEKCATEICRKCLLRSHVGKPCAQQNETKFRLWASSDGVKNCPECRARTQKNEGCNHMHC